VCKGLRALRNRDGTTKFLYRWRERDCKLRQRVIGDAATMSIADARAEVARLREVRRGADCAAAAHASPSTARVIADEEIPGMQLRIRPNGTRTFMLRYWVDGKEHVIGLGSMPEVTLEKARERARKYRAALADYIDPHALRAQERAERGRIERERAAAQAPDGLAFPSALPEAPPVVAGTTVIYMLVDPREYNGEGTATNGHLYVGRTRSPALRLRQHYWEALDPARESPKARFLRRLLREGVVARMVEIERRPNNDVGDAERRWISYYRERASDVTLKNASLPAQIAS
jgi:hypothetical protein